MELTIEEICNELWTKTEKIVLTDGEIYPTLFGIKETNGNLSKPIDLIPDSKEINWSIPEERYQLYYYAFRKKNEMKLDGIVSIFESWITTLDINGMIAKGLKPQQIKTQDDFNQLNKNYPELFDKSESISLYIEWMGESRVLWGRIFRENNSLEGKIVHISEFIEHNDDALDGIIRDAREQAHKELQ
jgi:hypothetical protein